MEIKANINLDEESMVNTIISVINSSSDDIFDNVEDRIERLISGWFSDNFDIENELRNVDFDDYIDIPDGIDDDDVRDKLDSYRPGNGCSTGNAFTEAVMKAFKYAAHSAEFEEEVKQTVLWIVRGSIKDIVREEIGDQVKFMINEKISNMNINETIRSLVSETFIHNKVKEFISKAFAI